MGSNSPGPSRAFADVLRHQHIPATLPVFGEVIHQASAGCSLPGAEKEFFIVVTNLPAVQYVFCLP